MLRSGFDQPVQDHCTGELACAAGDPNFAQDVAQAEAVPELVADMDGTRFAMVLGGNPVRIDGNVLALMPAGGERAVALAEGGRRLAAARFFGKAIERRVGGLQQVGLSGEGVFEFCGRAPAIPCAVLA
jgi:hypothetical protein